MPSILPYVEVSGSAVAHIVDALVQVFLDTVY
jgi:hypothetical protein